MPAITFPSKGRTRETFLFFRFYFIMERLHTRQCVWEARPGQQGGLWNQTRGKECWGARPGRRMMAHVLVPWGPSSGDPWGLQPRKHFLYSVLILLWRECRPDHVLGRPGQRRKGRCGAKPGANGAGGRVMGGACRNMSGP